MNVIWIVTDTLRRDHIGAYGNPVVRTPALDELAARSVRFDRHYASGFPTMPARADYATGRWTISFMGWEPLPKGMPTRVAQKGHHEARDAVAWRRHESDYNTPQTVQAALRWLERHHKEDFFLYVDCGTGTSRGMRRPTTPSSTCRATTARWCSRVTGRGATPPA